MKSKGFDIPRLGMLVLLLCLVSIATLKAEVKLPALVSDGMVLQRGQNVKIWGTADAGERIEVKFRGKTCPVSVTGKKLKDVYVVTADAAGKWSLTLPVMRAGGPYTMMVNDITIRDILVGDVWLCSGQSNMELPVCRVTDMFSEEIGSYNNENIRQIIIPKVYDFHAPKEDTPPTSWKALTQDNVMEFSALAYFFAKAVYEKTNIPVGIINASWGGTPVEAWISEEGLKPFPLYINDKRQYEDDGYLVRIKELENEKFRRWNEVLYRGDAGLHEEQPWYEEHYDDSAWQDVDMFSADWGNNGLNPIGGSHWFRQDITLTDIMPESEAILRLGCIVDADSVYVNGMFVGNTTYQYPPRIYNIPAGVLKEGRNNITVRLVSNGGQPAFVKEKPYKIIYRAKGEAQMKELNLKAVWKYHQGAPMPNAPEMMFFCYKPTGLYNAMIAPLGSYAMSGVLWYQGESNVSRRNEYAALLSAMIEDWRRTFSCNECPFFIVELADFLPKDDTEGRQAWAEMRKEQAKVTQTVPNTFLVKNSDLGEWNDIHPLDKKTLGKRAAEAVLKAYKKNK